MKKEFKSEIISIGARQVGRIITDYIVVEIFGDEIRLPVSKKMMGSLDHNKKVKVTLEINQ